VDRRAEVIENGFKRDFRYRAGHCQSRAKSLTLRLSEGQYERLRRFAFEHRLSHQDIIERGLLEYLDREERA
jgi:hypothetical protein